MPTAITSTSSAKARSRCKVSHVQTPDQPVAHDLSRLKQVSGTRFQLLKSLEVYFRAIRSAAARIGSHHEKQTFLKVVYENFYKVYNPKAADRLGVVYTPGEIVPGPTS